MANKDFWQRVAETIPHLRLVFTYGKMFADSRWQKEEDTISFKDK